MPLMKLERSRAGESDRGDVGNAPGQLVEDRLDLEPGEVGAEAEVRTPAAEAEVRVGVAADVEVERIARRCRRRGWPTGTRR